MIQNFWSWLHSNSFYNPSKILGTPKWRKLGNPVKPKILARFQKNLVHFHISPGAISRQGIAKIADIGLIFTLITQRTAQGQYLGADRPAVDWNARGLCAFSVELRQHFDPLILGEIGIGDWCHSIGSSSLKF